MVSSMNRTQSLVSKELETESSFALNLIPLPATPLFGTDGIRGKVGELLSAPLGLQIGFWAGMVLRDHAVDDGPIILGQDSRNSSDMLAMALSAGLTAAGLEVWYLGLCPTPCVAYLTSMTSAIGGVMISASHNPPEDNGIKIFGADGTKLSKELQVAIESGLRGKTTLSSSVKQWGKHYLRTDLIGNYGKALQHPLQHQVNLSGMKIVLDVAWGAAVGLAPTIFTQMGADVICLHNQPDGDRINVNCGSTHLDILADAVKEYGAHIGFAFDGDADRVLAVDNLGRQVNGDYILYLWGCELQGEAKLPDNLIISTVMANLGFERAWEQQGGKLIRTAVGDQYVQAEMLKTGGMLGGEQSGHILCRHYGMTGDGLLTALHLASIVKTRGLSLAQMIDESFQTYPQVLQNVRVEDREQRLGWEKCQPIQQAIALAEVAMGDSGRILVRASGTEPVIRVMVEAKDRELVNYWTREIVSQVQKHLG
ncbi:phosphoglucosamine mutase [Cylindrospermopsis raciborskii]|uniref:Phosphoglucosamine mutase n=2 Tax=Cylindrospermopsis raciborskii TaxID=77022 RepID=A0A1X4G8E9_9CYAN|nr:phosphoglucosamine mutase [Cylindrospermopsis raciborskii]EFA74372.1 Phosphoglucosamine mutase [Raphidiopsis brookii D9]MCZ2201253.1 phosphoglucosamine mutase [Cylindrospermopsis raciborskii PAMP2012]MCZ2205155.1 phosphoglucosamine mutase [Cylindrospermopsis raciborskii PAMP2011]NLQ06611.1 phosphoglucosamine mutase [Cylindrospermopsis raciborskii MVCC19]OHY34308.1 phosphoglucosamine mutase [Cylindrospermopsis raciborskii MVCC14]